MGCSQHGSWQTERSKREREKKTEATVFHNLLLPNVPWLLHILSVTQINSDTMEQGDYTQVWIPEGRIIGGHLRGWWVKPVSNLFWLYFLVVPPILILRILSKPLFPSYCTQSLCPLLHPRGFYYNVNTEDHLLSLDVSLLVLTSIFTFLWALSMCYVQY